MKRLIIIVDDKVFTFDTSPEKGFVAEWNQWSKNSADPTDVQNKYFTAALQTDSLPPTVTPYADWQKP